MRSQRAGQEARGAKRPARPDPVKFLAKLSSEVLRKLSEEFAQKTRRVAVQPFGGEFGAAHQSEKQGFFGGLICRLENPQGFDEADRPFAGKRAAHAVALHTGASGDFAMRYARLANRSIEQPCDIGMGVVVVRNMHGGTGVDWIKLELRRDRACRKIRSIGKRTLARAHRLKPKFLKRLVRPDRFERPTLRFVV